MNDHFFYLMHKDSIVTGLQIDIDNGSIIKTIPKGSRELVPLVN